MKQSTSFDLGHMVIDTVTSRIGFITDKVINMHWRELQHGADGPFSLSKVKDLRHATEKEIVAAGLDGVGRKFSPK